jgi:hypothetical protein
VAPRGRQVRQEFGQRHRPAHVRETGAMSDNLDAFAPVHTALESFQGYGLDALFFSVIGATDAMEISLRPLHPRPEVTLSLRDIHYFAVHRPPGDEVDFFDFEATTLIPGQPWPRELPAPALVVDGLPQLLWIRGSGPASFDVVAAIVSILSQIR